jgi:hypothetical protein
MNICTIELYDTSYSWCWKLNWNKLFRQFTQSNSYLISSEGLILAFFLLLRKVIIVRLLEWKMNSWTKSIQ